MHETERVKLLTLCFLHDEDRVLLGMKKRGFGEGKWNGFGGKVEPGETTEAAARREMLEECGLTAGTLEQRAVLDFKSEADPVTLRVHVFAVTDAEGEPQETEEMRPQWFARDAIPYDRMWSDDIHWLPKFLEGESFTGTFWFDDLADADAELLRHDLIWE